MPSRCELRLERLLETEHLREADSRLSLVAGILPNLGENLPPGVTRCLGAARGFRGTPRVGAHKRMRLRLRKKTGASLMDLLPELTRLAATA
jgi:hypothetical protein